MTASDLVQGRLGAVPAGKTPVVLTFDDSTRYQLFFQNGKLVPNTELGHLEFDGMEAEARASGRARIERKLDWPGYLKELSYVLDRTQALFWPDLIVLCGGITADHPHLTDDLKVPTQLKIGALRADAGSPGTPNRCGSTAVHPSSWTRSAKATTSGVIPGTSAMTITAGPVPRRNNRRDLPRYANESSV